MIRDATSDDVRRIAEIHAHAWHEAYCHIVSPEVLAKVTPASRFEVWSEWFRVGAHEVNVLEQDSRIVGFIRMCAARDIEDPPEGYGELSHLYLDPTQIAKGLGHRLFSFASARLQQREFDGMLLWTLEQNARARRFYEAHEMSHDGARYGQPDWLGPGVFEVRYVLPFGRG